MPLQPKDPIVVPAKTLDKLWVIRIEINAPSLGGDANVAVQLLPYNDQGETGEVFAVNFHNVLEEIEGGNELLANAFEAIMTAVQYKLTPEAFEEPEEP
jgi:hypothetical protein